MSLADITTAILTLPVVRRDQMISRLPKGLTGADLEDIRLRRANGESVNGIAYAYGICKQRVYQIIS